MVAHATTKREQDDQRLAEATNRLEQARDQLAALQHGPGRFLRRGDLARVRAQARQAEEAQKVARQAADRAADRELKARHAQQQHQAHHEANPNLVAEYQAVVREDKWRTRAEARAVELLQPGWSRELGQRPTSIKGGRAWDRAVEQTLEYRHRWNIDEGERALGPEPHGKDAPLEQRRAKRHAKRAIGRMHDLTSDQAERPDRTEATGRQHDQRSDRGRADHHDRDHERAM